MLEEKNFSGKIMNIILDMYSLRESPRRSSGNGIYRDRRFTFVSQNVNGKWNHGDNGDCLGREKQVRGGPRKKLQGAPRQSREADVRKGAPEMMRKQGEKQGGCGAPEFKADSFATRREWLCGQEKSELKSVPCAWKSLVTLAWIWWDGGKGAEPRNWHLPCAFLVNETLMRTESSGKATWWLSSPPKCTHTYTFPSRKDKHRWWTGRQALATPPDSLVTFGQDYSLLASSSSLAAISSSGLGYSETWTVNSPPPSPFILLGVLERFCVSGESEFINISWQLFLIECPCKGSSLGTQPALGAKDTSVLGRWRYSKSLTSEEPGKAQRVVPGWRFQSWEEKIFLCCFFFNCLLNLSLCLIQTELLDHDDEYVQEFDLLQPMKQQSIRMGTGIPQVTLPNETNPRPEWPSHWNESSHRNAEKKEKKMQGKNEVILRERNKRRGGLYKELYRENGIQLPFGSELASWKNNRGLGG